MKQKTKTKSKAKKKIDKPVSYYDTKDKDKYIADDKNLAKIRSKNLRQFCKFYKMMEETPVILSLKSERPIKDLLSDIHSRKGAKAILSQIKENKNPELIKLSKNLGINIAWLSKRTIYDYMNALKFIRACEGRRERMMLGLFDKKKP